MPLMPANTLLMFFWSPLRHDRLLDYAIDETKVRKQDSYIAVAAVAGNTLGKFLAWDWLRGNWDTLYEE